MDPAERARSLASLKLERDAVQLYERLADIERDPVRAASFQAIASNERRHAFIWANRLRLAGRSPQETGRDPWHTRTS